MTRLYFKNTLNYNIMYPFISINVSLSEEMLEDLAKIAKQSGRPINDIASQMLYLGLNSELDKMNPSRVAKREMAIHQKMTAQSEFLNGLGKHSR